MSMYLSMSFEYGYSRGLFGSRYCDMCAREGIEGSCGSRKAVVC